MEKQIKITITNIDELEKFHILVNKKEIEITEAYAILKKSKGKLYASKFWKLKREELLKSSCENCGSTEKLTLQHTKQPELPLFIECWDKAKVNLKWCKVGKVNEKEKGKIKAEASVIQLNGYIDSFKEYMECINTKTNCNKCSYAEDFKDSTRLFCEEHNHYYYSRYGCDECNDVANGIKYAQIEKVDDLVRTCIENNLWALEINNIAENLKGEEQYWFIVKINKALKFKQSYTAYTVEECSIKSKYKPEQKG